MQRVSAPLLEARWRKKGSGGGYSVSSNHELKSTSELTRFGSLEPAYSGRDGGSDHGVHAPEDAGGQLHG